MHATISCGKTKFKNTFSLENRVFCADEFQLCGVSFLSFVDLPVRFHCKFREQKLYRQFVEKVIKKIKQDNQQTAFAKKREGE